MRRDSSVVPFHFGHMRCAPFSRPSFTSIHLSSFARTCALKVPHCVRARNPWSQAQEAHRAVPNKALYVDPGVCSLISYPYLLECLKFTSLWSVIVIKTIYPLIRRCALRVLSLVELRLIYIITSSHLHIYISAHLHICISTSLLIFTSAHLHLCTSSTFAHLYISAHLHICICTSLLIFTSAYVQLCSSSHLHICTSTSTSSHLHISRLHPSLFFFRERLRRVFRKITPA